MGQDDEKPDFQTLTQEWGYEDIQRIVKIYGSLTAPNAKEIGAMFNPVTHKRGEKPNPTKQQIGGLKKSVNAMERLTEMRLLYLYLTLDVGMDQKIARSDLAKVYQLSKSRIRDLVAIPKSNISKK